MQQYGIERYTKIQTKKMQVKSANTYCNSIFSCIILTPQHWTIMLTLEKCITQGLHLERK